MDLAPYAVFCIALFGLPLASLWMLLRAFDRMADRMLALRSPESADALGRLRGVNPARPGEQEPRRHADEAIPPLFSEQFGKDFDQPGN